MSLSDELTQLLEFTKLGNQESVLRLLRANPSLIIASNHEGYTMLHWAALYDQWDIAKSVLEKGAAVDLRSVDGSTPLCQACVAGNLRMAELLLSYGAAVNPQFTLDSALHEAVHKGHARLCKLLVDHGALLNASDCYYGTPLHVAAKHGRLECARILLDAGSNVNATKIHSTPLHYATERGDSAMVNLLVAYGANHWLVDNSGRRPVDYLTDEHPSRPLLIGLDGSPRDLADCCRIRIRQMAVGNIVSLALLPLPMSLIDFLLHRDG